MEPAFREPAPSSRINLRRNCKERAIMKTVTTILSAALLAASCTLAMAQSGGGGASGGGAGSDVNPDRMGKGADQNPTGPAANPAGGTKEAVTPGTARTGATAASGMTTAPVAGTKSNSSNPAQAPTADNK